MLIHTVKKEARLIANDLHSLAVLLLMPILFMVIMTMASSQSQQNMQSNLSLSIIGKAYSKHSNVLIELLKAQGFIVPSSPITQTKQSTLTIAPKFDQLILMRQGTSQLTLEISDELAPQTRMLMTEKVKASLAQLKLYLYMLDTGDLDVDLPLNEQISQIITASDVSYLLAQQSIKALDNPALNSVPAWWVFGIYFIVLPISLTFINERNNGTLVRLKTYPISMARYFYNKACAYVLVSIVQGGLLALIGCIVIPYCLDLPLLSLHGLLYSILTFITVSCTAIAFALLLASLVSSYEQAIVVGGGVNIILAALSGFMVPLEIMPDNLAALANGSPMYWSAQLLRQLMSESIDHTFWQYSASLWGFSLLCFTAALWTFNKKMRNLTWN
ncbi:ABC transporter permease [Pseudoalteromonas sp. NEC-BIFX-2020_002]|uniref:ABC transporter permease n=1 Tax=Pseudoalteromonas sp. NEC-BIFX-2020_002 TaxID=2732353 RepID=UPI001476C9E1|nr:ABC transporter permease [Pseudoalteromonas sp. NEC-BIFX-2020_002]NNG41412.1 ABC transporter permease [Pseudoalteromonas sp. NEC-BIFX-2020_002]